jgi:hypothetical protein
MAKRAERPALLIEGEAVTGAAILLHVDRLESRAVGRDLVAIRAAELLTALVALGQPTSHLRHAAGRVKVQGMREL